MPHLPRFILEGSCYHTISVTHQRHPVFKNRSSALALIESLDFIREHGKAQVLAYAILPDHAHILIAPLGDPSISDVMKSFKNFSARRINVANGVKGSVWQRSFYDRVIRDEAQLEATVEYIHANPVQAGLATAPSGYEFSSAHPSASTDLEAFFAG